jgi:hypothetical protein
MRHAIFSRLSAHLVLEGVSLEGRSIKVATAYTKVAVLRAAIAIGNAGSFNIAAHLVFRWSEAERTGRNNDS